MEIKFLRNTNPKKNLFRISLYQLKDLSKICEDFAANQGSADDAGQEAR